MRKVIFLILIICICCSGCSKKKESIKIKDIEFTVCDEGKLPDELVNIINEKKENSFKLTYSNQDYLFIVVGYGEQNRGDLSITVDELFLSKNAVYVDTNLVGSKDSKADKNLISYPYIAIKCEKYDLPVVFK